MTVIWYLGLYFYAVFKERTRDITVYIVRQTDFHGGELLGEGILHVSSSTTTFDFGQIEGFTGWTGVATIRVYGRITETIFDDVSGEHLDDEELPLLSTLQIPPDITDMLIVYPDDGDTDPCVAVRDRLGCISSWCI